ncbi:MAG: hypothetical protein QM207_06190, partial [Thermobispora sp.]|nr:hypothetical protein [Thermobispora sp.]
VPRSVPSWPAAGELLIGECPYRIPHRYFCLFGRDNGVRVAFALPFSFEYEDYEQILTDIATKLGPALGRRPST